MALARRARTTCGAALIPLSNPVTVTRILEATDAKGGDKRCTDDRTAYVAYILIVDKSGKETYITASDQDSPNPITALRARYKGRTRN